jgi:hypothetical protein
LLPLRLWLVGWLRLHNWHWHSRDWHALRLLLLVHWARLRLRLRLHHGLLHWLLHWCARLRLLVHRLRLGLLNRCCHWHCYWWLLLHYRAGCWPASKAFHTEESQGDSHVGCTAYMYALMHTLHGPVLCKHLAWMHACAQR